MILSETNLQIKKDLWRFINGDYDDCMSQELVEWSIKFSFLLNHIETSDFNGTKDRLLIFEYGKHWINLDINYHNSEEEIIHSIMNSDVFKTAVKSFLRQHKLNKILNKLL